MMSRMRNEASNRARAAEFPSSLIILHVISSFLTALSTQLLLLTVVLDQLLH